MMVPRKRRAGSEVERSEGRQVGKHHYYVPKSLVVGENDTYHAHDFKSKALGALFFRCVRDGK